ncbi:MAG: hypothetical protein EPN25_15115 [Nitrospirae bacterium]|nr:MAG: hypothetical protein EPN25_15115 [Nitrospirota bacterium]
MAPLFSPGQVQVHGPVPLIALGVVPASPHETLVGAAVNVCPLGEPQTPGIGVVGLAEQFAVVPPFKPGQVQVHGPVPLIALGVVPANPHETLEGADAKVCPFGEPHCPGTGAT